MCVAHATLADAYAALGAETAAQTSLHDQRIPVQVGGKTGCQPLSAHEVVFETFCYLLHPRRVAKSVALS